MRKVDDRSKLDDSAIGRALRRLNDLVRQRGLKSSATREAVAREDRPDKGPVALVLAPLLVLGRPRPRNDFWMQLVVVAPWAVAVCATAANRERVSVTVADSSD